MCLLRNKKSYPINFLYYYGTTSNLEHWTILGLLVVWGTDSRGPLRYFLSVPEIILRVNDAKSCIRETPGNISYKFC